MTHFALCLVHIQSGTVRLNSVNFFIRWAVVPSTMFLLDWWYSALASLGEIV